MRVTSLRSWRAGAVIGLLTAPDWAAAAWAAIASEPCPPGPGCVMLVDLETGARVDPARLAAQVDEKPHPFEAGATWAGIIAAAVVLLVVGWRGVGAAKDVRMRALDVELAKLLLRELGAPTVRQLGARCQEMLNVLEAEDVADDPRLAPGVEPLRRACGELKRLLSSGT